jgi:NADH:ubiquinone oxidoreductase subunit C
VSSPVSSPWAQRVLASYVDGLGEPVTVEDGFPPVTVDVPSQRWVEAVTLARDVLGCTFFDWLSAVDESAPGRPGGLEDGFRIVCHLAARRTGDLQHVAVRTLVPRAEPVVASVAGVFAGARWHERETHEMFGVDFSHDDQVLRLEPLLLPEEFEGHPLRKEFVLASRAVRPWPGAKEPGESDAAPRTSGPRRRARPPGVPDPAEWGPR